MSTNVRELQYRYPGMKNERDILCFLVNHARNLDYLKNKRNFAISNKDVGVNF